MKKNRTPKPDWEPEQQRALRHARRQEQRGGIPCACSVCGENHPAVQYERHHPAGRANSGETILVCRNCHDKLSDAQQDWPDGLGSPPLPFPRGKPLAARLLSVADMMGLQTEILRQIALAIGGEDERE